MTASRMPKGSIPMTTAYNEAIYGADSSDNSDRGNLKSIRKNINPITNNSIINNQSIILHEATLQHEFPKLPNPSILMYVYPHEVGSGKNLVPVPGYFTVLPLYRHVYYKMLKEV